MRPSVIRKDYVRMRARSLIKEYHIIRPPVDLEYLAQKLDITIHYFQIAGLDFSFLVKYHGRYYAFVYISGFQNRDRWSLAHEIAHVVLGHCELYQVDTIDKDILTDTERYVLDREADIFTEELLMPSEWILQHRNSSIAQLQNVFGVSKEAISIRINSLQQTAANQNI